MNIRNNKFSFLSVLLLIFSFFAVFSISLAGCAPVDPQEIQDLKVQVKKLNEKTGELSQDNEYLKGKLGQMQLNLANNGVKISTLESRISDINGKYEVESHELRILQKNFEEYRVMANKQFAKLLKLNNAFPPSGSVSGSSSSRDNGNAPRISPGKQEFDKAMSLFNKKDFAGSEKAFADLLGSYPKSRYAGEAMFYRAQANFNLKKYPVSILQFHKFSQIYPDNPNVPMAIYLQGLGFLKVSDPSDASILFRQVISKYAGSGAARLSKIQLGKLSK